MDELSACQFRLLELLNEHGVMASAVDRLEAWRRLVRLYEWSIRSRSRIKQRSKKQRNWPDRMRALARYAVVNGEAHRHLHAELSSCENAIRYFARRYATALATE